MKWKNAHLLLGTGLVLLAGCSSDDKIEVVAPEVDRQAPVVSLQDQQVMADTLANRIALSIRDNQDGAAQLAIEVTSSNPEVVSEAGLTVNLEGESIFLDVTPEVDTVGQTVINVSATDRAQNSAQQSFTLDVLANQVAAAEFLHQLQQTEADEEPSFVNAIELLEDDMTEALLNDLFSR